eukprot:CAMPEP_0116825242 /NCGR_PEP_ID=MMETSP0418-20121206/1851_1 /TAXON_ID=1158023 /ORGANISM="Astrosyne radiata, Strain 13vi08-1A" /LENGTH=191 /DNA_ID=CAMNT_0004453717 /DNA_START=215 /DNA_END=790 /DNA_ORIENTATION=+
MEKVLSLVVFLSILAGCVSAFGIPQRATTTSRGRVIRFMSESEMAAEPASESRFDPMEEAIMDEEAQIALEKKKRIEELRAQEVWTKKSTGLYKCGSCDWVYDAKKGDIMMIGGKIEPGTAFQDLPSNWRCPVCKASKDSFSEEAVVIAGFEANQKYGLGGNSMTESQKTTVIFGGLAFFFILFLSGYALS